MQQNVRPHLQLALFVWVWGCVGVCATIRGSQLLHAMCLCLCECVCTRSRRAITKRHISKKGQNKRKNSEEDHRTGEQGHVWLKRIANCLPASDRTSKEKGQETPTHRFSPAAAAVAPQVAG